MKISTRVVSNNFLKKNHCFQPHLEAHISTSNILDVTHIKIAGDAILSGIRIIANEANDLRLNSLHIIGIIFKVAIVDDLQCMDKVAVLLFSLEVGAVAVHDLVQWFFIESRNPKEPILVGFQYSFYLFKTVWNLSEFPAKRLLVFGVGKLVGVEQRRDDTG